MAFAQTKIRQPRSRPGVWLPRPALEGALATALLQHRVVLVCAAAGYGKTSTLVQALSQLPAGTAVAWVSVDEGDDLHRLLNCLTAALEPYDPPWRSAPEGLVAAATRPGAEGRQAVAAELVNTLDACGVPQGVIVFDDLHHVTDTAALQFLDQWLARMSPRWTVALAARHEPALRLSRLRASGELAEFREAQLQFAPDEVRALVASAGQDAAQADALHARTAGWPAGLRLALGGAHGGVAGTTPGGSAIDRQAFDFLADEVLARIDPALREFLLLSSVLPDLDAARAAAVTGDAQAERWLDATLRLGLFVTVVDEAQPTLRLHDLFRAALQHRLRLERPERWPLLLRRAATVESDPVRRHALLAAAGEWHEAARLLHAARVRLQATSHFGVHTLMQLCEQFPADFAATSPELQLTLGMVRWTVWEVRAAERHLALAEQLYTERGDADGALVTRQHRAVTLIAAGRLAEARALLPPLDRPPPGLAGVVSSLARTWLTLESCDFHAVAPCFEHLVQALEAQTGIEAWSFTVPPPRQTTCRGVQPLLARWAHGALAAAGDRPVSARAAALLTQGWLALWQGRVDDAAATLARAESDIEWTGQPVVQRHHALALRGLLHAVREERAQALAVMHQRVGEHPGTYGDWGLWHNLFIASRVAASCGDAEAMQGWLQRIRSVQAGLPDAEPQRLFPLVGLEATLAWMQGQADAAIAGWQQALARESHVDLFGQAAELRVRLALALLRRGARQDAAAVLAPLLAPADASPGGALLAGEALRELAASPWGAALPAPQLAMLQRWAGAAAAAVPASTPAARHDPVLAGDQGLSTREVEVLAQIAAGASNKLIARALDLSPHTVKRHVANILDKLQLASRAQATAWYLAHQGR